MPVLNGQLVANAYPTSAPGAIIQNVWNSRGGWFSVSGAQAFVKLQYGPLAQDHWTEEVLLGNGAFVVLPANCTGVQFRNGVANLVATVTAQIAQGDEPPLGVSAIGSVALSVASLNFQHNDLAVSTEPTLDFIDEASGTSLTWTVVDDAANTRVRVTPVWGNPTIFPHAISTGPASSTFTGTQVNGVFIDTSGRITAFNSGTQTVFNAGLNADTVNRFNLTNQGQLQWGPGGAGALDSSLSRLAVGVIGSTTTGLTTGPVAFAAPTSTAGVLLQPVGAIVLATSSATNNIFTSVVSNGTDTASQFILRADGRLAWGPGNATQDVILQRQVNLPSGTGSFLELVAGAGFGYGSGTGGIITQATSRTTAVTINKPTGAITTAATSTGVGPTTFVFTVNNTCVGINDAVILSTQGLDVTTDNYRVASVGAGTFQISYDVTGSNVLTQFKFNFAVIKGAVT